ncbi:uncharacterized protein PV09_09269 [Verruconis gallopava]|uniref:Helicase C-terminal domain-containing protein n=1 Tax=Verruconis gallopava TaxID=253628 RepID=A0A0D1ZY27_9PEZI|nr:uncharacterized protein PV09_09269 [Verruconis gallopava]KIV98989.1 hypothetical protein PV09_09269 [Verruconis gallopava]
MLRRTEKTTLQGIQLVPMPQHCFEDVHVTINKEDAQLLKKLQEYAEAREKALLKQLGSKNDDISVGNLQAAVSKENCLKAMRTTRFFACFPHLLTVEIPDNQLLSNAITKMATDDSKEKMLWAYLHLDLIDQSPKIRLFRKILDQLDKNEPFVCFSANPAEAFTMYMWTKYKYCNGKSEYFRPGLSKMDKTAMVNWFMDNNSTTSTRFLFGRCSNLGVGYSLTRAFRCFLIQPEWLRSVEEQAKGRIWRTGLAQKAVKTYTYRCILDDFEPERIIVARHNARGIVTDEIGEATGINPEIEEEGNDDSGEDN